MKIRIECTIREIEEAVHYSGQIRIGRGTFTFDLHLAGSLSNLSRREPIRDLEGERLVYQLILSREGTVIGLSDKQYYFFLSFIMESALRCYCKLLRHRVEKLFYGKITSFVAGYSEPESDTTPDVQIEIYEVEFSLCKMLNDPKFDCKLVG